MLLVARSRLVSQRQATANTIRGLLKTFGLVVAPGSKGLFSVRVREQIAGNPALIAVIEPLLAVWHAVRDQVAMLDRQMLARARNDQVARRLMTIPGVGIVIALAYTAVIDDPARFRRSVSVGAYLGLTPGVTSPVRSTPLGTSRNAGQPATRISLRSRRSAPLSRRPHLSPEELGPGARETNWHATRQSRGRAQARGHHASDLERSERIPLGGDTIDYRLRVTPQGNSFLEIRRV